MKQAIDSSHREFFQKNAFVEFENLLSEKQLDQMTQGILEACKKRLHIYKSAIPPATLFQEGRDLWRSSSNLQKIVTKKQLAEIAAELLEQRSLRLGFDQYLPSLPIDRFVQNEKCSDSYTTFLSKELTLNHVSCIQGTLCGLAICLKAPENPPDHSLSIFSPHRGSGIYFKADLPIDFKVLAGQDLRGADYLLITYAHPSSVYVFQPEDPQTHYLKKLDFVFGDKLSDKTHPTLIRT